MKRYSKKQTLQIMYIIISALLLAVIGLFPKNNYLIFEENALVPNLNPNRKYNAQLNNGSILNCKNNQDENYSLTLTNGLQTLIQVGKDISSDTEIKLEILNNFDCSASLNQLSVISDLNVTPINYIPYNGEISNTLIYELVSVTGQKIKFSPAINLKKLSDHIISLTNPKENIYALKIQDKIFFTKNCLDCQIDYFDSSENQKTSKQVVYDKSRPSSIISLAEITLINRNLASVSPISTNITYNFKNIDSIQQINQTLIDSKQSIFRINFKVENQTLTNVTKNIDLTTSLFENQNFNLLFLESELTSEIITKINKLETGQLIYIIQTNGEKIKQITSNKNLIII
jgi:hypothetical protein